MSIRQKLANFGPKPPELGRIQFDVYRIWPGFVPNSAKSPNSAKLRQLPHAPQRAIFRPSGSEFGKDADSGCPTSINQTGSGLPQTSFPA